jgi:Fe-S-cluster containining protein
VLVKGMKFNKSAHGQFPAFAAVNDGGRWRIRTPVSGSEGRKDIQTTLIARNPPERTPLLEEGGWRGFVMARSLPCIPSGCSACCRETTMPITKAEASRLARRTGMKLDDFSVQNDGVLTLLNNAQTRACVFLLTDSADLNAEGMCSVYEIRPKGCQTYPYVLDASDQAVLDEGCLHRTQFPPPPEGIGTVLLNLEERIVREGSSD